MRRHTLASTLLVSTAAFLPTQPAAAAEASCDDLTHRIHHLSNTNSGASLLTPWHGEAGSAEAKYGFSTTRPGFRTSVAAKPQLQPVQRSYNSDTNDFAWTTGDAPSGYTLQKTNFYASPTALSCTAPVYSYTKHGMHQYAWSATVDAQLQGNGWERGAVVFHAVPHTDAPRIGDGTANDVAPIPEATPLHNETACRALSTTIHHRSKGNSGTTLLTRWKEEADRAAEKYGFTGKQASFAAATEKIDGLSPVTRYYSSRDGDFLWSIKPAPGEYDAHKVNFYAAEKPLTCTVPLHRYVKGSKHRFTWTDDEHKQLLGAGWRHEGPQFHVVPQGGHTPVGGEDSPEPVTPVPDNPAPGTPGADGDGVFTFALVGDTQREVLKDNDTRLANRLDYIASTARNKDTRYTLQLGDLVNWDTPTHDQYVRADAAISRFEKTSNRWAGTIGNHDTAATCEGGSACPGTDVRKTIRDTTTYNKYFGVSRFSGRADKVSGTFEQGKIDNAYRTFSAEGHSWLLLNLELYPRAEAVAWAVDVVKSHPTHNVVVMTHSYLGQDGNILTNNEHYGALTPAEVQERLVVPHANVKFVFSGHKHTFATHTSTTKSGSKVVHVMTDHFADGGNPISFATVDTRKGTLSLKTYSPINDMSFPNFDKVISGLTFVK